MRMITGSSFTLRSYQVPASALALGSAPTEDRVGTVGESRPTGNQLLAVATRRGLRNNQP